MWLYSNENIYYLLGKSIYTVGTLQNYISKLIQTDRTDIVVLLKSNKA